MAKTKYRADFPKRAEKLAREGLIDTEIAKKLGIHPHTYYRYQKLYSEFSESILRGKIDPNVLVEQALYKRALGHPTSEEHTEYAPGKKGKKPELKVLKKIKKHLAGDVVAQKFWLQNRDPKRWKEKQEIKLTVKDLSLKKLKESAKALEKSETEND